MNKIIKGDQVVVIAGKDKGKQGQVVRVLGDKVVVEGVNVVKRHQKPNPMRGIEGGIITKEMPLDVSNIAILNPETNKADRVGIKLIENEGKVKRVRFFKSNGSIIGAQGDNMARLREFYKDTVVPELVKQFGYKSVMEVPRIEKITLNMGVGEAVADKKVMEHAVSDLEKIAGQKPVVTVARKSIAGFKIRDNYPVGCKVTLRRDQMFEFLDRLITIALPRVRDFRGVSGKSFDGRGNYNMGVREQIIFPEIEYDKIDALRGLNITITTTAKTDEEAKALLSLFKFPFKG